MQTAIIMIFLHSFIGITEECYESPLNCDNWNYGWSILPHVGDENLWGMATVPHEELNWVITMMNFNGYNHCDVEGTIRIRWFINSDEKLGSYGPHDVYLPIGDMILIDEAFRMTVPENVNSISIDGIFDGHIQTCPPTPTTLPFVTPRPVTHPADVTRNLQIDNDDITEIFEFWGSDNFRADINDDNIVDMLDLIEVIINYGWTYD